MRYVAGETRTRLKFQGSFPVVSIASQDVGVGFDNKNLPASLRLVCDASCAALEGLLRGRPRRRGSREPLAVAGSTSPLFT